VPNRAMKADAAATEPAERTRDFFTEPDLRNV
jgi:hypothetical protein